jgi:hypothetical protein
MQKSVLLFIVTSIALSFIAAVAQETDTALANRVGSERLMIEMKDGEGLANRGLELKKEIKPRLPNGFGPVVNPIQKGTIYAIQRDYNGLIALLELRIELLKKERDAKIDAVLTPDQLERVRTPTRKTGSQSRSL